MKTDKLEKCGRCGGDCCYINEVTLDLKTYLCYGCGFFTNTLMVKDSEFFEKQFEILPELYKSLMDEDEDGKIWIPTTINNFEKGMVFADGTSRDNWRWGATKVIDVLDEEKEKYPIPGKKGEYYTKRMDMSTLKHFKEHDFMDALSYIDLLP